jgi:hypothetical protein
MSERELVYISGPISNGNRNLSFYQASEAQLRLIQTGDYAVYNPMLSMALFANNEISWEHWLENDEAWIEKSDLVLRLPGESKGADREVRFAVERGLPVVTTSYFECLRGLVTHPGDPSHFIALCLHDKKRAESTRKKVA